MESTNKEETKQQMQGKEKVEELEKVETVKCLSTKVPLSRIINHICRKSKLLPDLNSSSSRKSSIQWRHSRSWDSAEPSALNATTTTGDTLR